MEEKRKIVYIKGDWIIKEISQVGGTYYELRRTNSDVVLEAIFPAGVIDQFVKDFGFLPY